MLRLDPAIAGSDIESSLSKFDALYTSSMNWNTTDQPLQGLNQFNNGELSTLSIVDPETVADRWRGRHYLQHAVSESDEPAWRVHFDQPGVFANLAVRSSNSPCCKASASKSTSCAASIPTAS